MAVEWYQVRPGRATMVEFSDGDAKVLKPGTVFKEDPNNRCVQRLLRGKRPRLRKMGKAEVDYLKLGEEPIVLLEESN